MALRRPFSALHSEFDAFLFASIGEEGTGMPVSVLSALARLGIDGRAEAARLAAFPEPVAIEILAPMIARMSGGRLDRPDTVAVAGRLVRLLPRRPGPARHPQLRRPTSWWLVWVVGCAILAGAGILGVALNGELPFGKGSPSGSISRSLAPPQVQP